MWLDHRGQGDVLQDGAGEVGRPGGFGLYSKEREPLKSIKQVSNRTQIVLKPRSGENGL